MMKCANAGSLQLEARRVKLIAHFLNLQSLINIRKFYF